MREDDRFVRMLGKVAKTVSVDIYALYANNAGGRVRFKTDAKTIRIIAELFDIFGCDSSTVDGCHTND